MVDTISKFRIALRHFFEKLMVQKTYIKHHVVANNWFFLFYDFFNNLAEPYFIIKKLFDLPLNFQI
jgi:hypothetical protein